MTRWPAYPGTSLVEANPPGDRALVCSSKSGEPSHQLRAMTGYDRPSRATPNIGAVVQFEPLGYIAIKDYYASVCG